MNTPLPIKRSLTLAFALSLVVALLVAGGSLAGLLFQGSLYPTQELRRSFVANDAVNLFIGLPILLGALWLSRRGRLIGLLFWPGAPGISAPDGDGLSRDYRRRPGPDTGRMIYLTAWTQDYHLWGRITPTGGQHA
jgi:hypothetical protein